MSSDMMKMKKADLVERHLSLTKVLETFKKSCQRSIQEKNDEICEKDAIIESMTKDMQQLEFEITSLKIAYYSHTCHKCHNC